MNESRHEAVTIDLAELDRTHISVAGGKAAHLGELTDLDDVVVPRGFCVTTAAYERAIATSTVDEQLERLASAAVDDVDAVEQAAATIRAAIESTPVPAELATDIDLAVSRLGDGPLAVRSSATVEDSPVASFAGQHDSFLHVDPSAVVDHVRRCWASLFTDRAVAYRTREGVDHRSVHMAVVVQQMVDAEVSGVMFTADPSTSNRRTVVIEATHGLAEDLVAGRANTTASRVRDGDLVDTDGTNSLLRDDRIRELAQLGRRIEAHFARPQDIEWCITGDTISVVQARPVTGLFPIPPATDDGDHVYVSVGHNQMMTDAMTPLGLSVWQMTTPAPMVEAASRLFVDVTARVAAPGARSALLELFGRGDPLMRDALETVLDRDGFLPMGADDPDAPSPGPLPDVGDPIDADRTIVTALIDQTQASIDAARRQLADTSGVDLFDFIADDIAELRARLFDPVSHQATMAGIEATWWINERVAEWLGEPNAADALTQAAPDNVTSEMGLALLDVADVVRPHPEVVDRLRRAERENDDHFLTGLADTEGGSAARAAIVHYLDRYGMRCVGEIDLGRPRWAEHPSRLLPALLTDVDHFAPGEAVRRVERGRRIADTARRELLDRLRTLPDGERKAAETDAMIERLRTFIGYREYPKYGMITRYWLYKKSLLREADRLVDQGAIRSRDDVFFLRFDEFREAVRTSNADTARIDRRRADHRRHQSITPPRVTTSDGDAHNGRYRGDAVPAGTLTGLGVSGGIVEGRARVVTDIAAARLEPGDILVTTHTDPSWSPLFVTAAGLVTEVGGLMTHGAVVAREYGLPAVVAVDHATRRIRDGQRIRIDGTLGHVQVLGPPNDR